MNIRNYHIYSDKFTLSVVDLKEIELATEEDKANGIDYWARLFKAKTWEEIKVLAENNECLQEAADSLYVANSDEVVRQQCLAREEAERHERTMKRDIWKLKEEKEQLLREKEQLLREKEQWSREREELKLDNIVLKDSLSEMEVRLKKWRNY